MVDNELIHLFKTGGNYYLYDVNTDEILKIQKSVYNFLHNRKLNEEPTKDVKSYLDKMHQDGFLSSNRVNEIVHPANDILEYHLNRKLHTLILQVTQNCNLRCHYCAYSGNYENRTHSSKKMDFALAKRGIDFLLDHSQDTEMIGIAFYGGEPLLMFDLIKDCVIYAESQTEGKEVYITLTTNGTLISKEIIDFFVLHNVHIMISIDGPKNIHDKNRVFVNNQGSFDTLYNNINFIKNEYPSYYNDNISFNMVLDTENNFNCVNDFIIKDNIFTDTTVNSTIISDNYLKKSYEIKDDFISDREYEIFKLYLFELKKLKKEFISPILFAYYNHMAKKRAGKQNESCISLPHKAHPGGPCIAGAKRLFMSVDGTFYPCERCSECSAVMKIGNIDSGIDVEKARNLMNVGKISEEHCKNCWAFRYCNNCCTSADNLSELSYDVLKGHCDKVKLATEEELKDYCALKELGHEFQY